MSTPNANLTPPALRRPSNWHYLLALIAVFPFTLLAGVGMIVALVAVIGWGQTAAPGVPGALLSVTVLVVCYPVALATHELGHAVTARAFGWPIVAFRVGPSVWERRAGRWVWCVNWRANWLSGVVLAAPTFVTRRRTCLHSLAGPAINLACGSFFLLALVGSLPGWLRCAAVVFAVHSLWFGAFNLLPFRSRGLESDGGTLFKLWLNPGWVGPANATATRAQVGLPPLA